MPTATDIDNRPVAIGKWPRLRGSSNRNAAIISTNHALTRYGRDRTVQSSIVSNAGRDGIQRVGGQLHQESNTASSGKHSDWCTLENCVHNCDEDASNPCIDVLLNPELLQEFYGDKCLTSANPLLEFCLDGGFSRKFPTSEVQAFANKKINGTTQEEEAQLPSSVLSLCSTCSRVQDVDKSQFVSQLRMNLRQTGCDINVQDSQGYTALHHLIQGCSKENFALVEEAVELLLSQNNLNPTTFTCNPDIYDSQDHNSPLTGLHVLLDRNMPQASLVKLAQLLLAHDFNADHINGQERTLLTYSVSKGDSALDLTRCLLNHGALILPARSNVVRDRSAFTWLVRSLMKEQSLDSHRETILLLCQNMAEVVGPEAMRSHTLSTMIHLGHSASVMAPLFLQLKSILAPFWSQPLDLVHLCRSSIRHSLGPKNLSLGTTKLNLPPSLSQYLHYDYYFQCP